MSPLFGPILAQLVTLGVSDRTEVRHVVTDESYSEVATNPRVALNFGWKHATLSLGYSPALTVTPLDNDPTLIVYHSGTVAASNRWQRTTVTASESIGYGKVDFQDQAIAAPGTAPVTTVPVDMGMAPGNTGTGTMAQPGTGGTPTGTTGTGMATGTGTPATGAAANQFRATDTIERFSSSVSTVSVTQLVSAVLTVNGGVWYMVTGTPGSQTNVLYPTVKGPGARIAAAYTPTHYDAVTTSVSTQYAESSDGSDAWLMFANEAWAHQLDKGTVTTVGAGLSLTRNSEPIGLIYYSIYPNFVLGITHTSLIGRSTLTFGLTASSSPYLDPVSVVVDPRISAGAFIGFHQDRFSSSLTGGTAISLATQGNTGAFNALYGAFGMSYVLGSAVSIDSGVRASYQTFEGHTAIPLSLALYVGVTFGTLVHLNSSH
jgi:hypothetical protein